jgi:hypothetical protein
MRRRSGAAPARRIASPFSTDGGANAATAAFIREEEARWRAVIGAPNVSLD